MRINFKFKSGFTLIELLVVVAIIGLLEIMLCVPLWKTQLVTAIITVFVQVARSIIIALHNNTYYYFYILPK